MAILIFIIIFIACIIGGFCDMPILFIFPILSIIVIIAVIANPKNIDDTKTPEKPKSNITENEIQDLTFFDMIDKK